MPKRGLSVEVELDHNLQVTGITAVPEPPIAHEQAEGIVEVAKERGRDIAPSEIVRRIAERFGAPALIAAGLLLVGWFFLTTLSIAIPLASKLNLTFWQLLGLLNAPNAIEALDRSANLASGIYSLFAAIALTGPFLHHFWKDRRALLGGLAPLAFMLIIGIASRSSIQNAFVPNVSGPYAEMAREAGSEAMKDVSFGFGAYFSGLVGLYFAGVAVWRFLVTNRSHRAENSRSAAA